MAVDADGRFVIRGVIPGPYRVVPSVGVPPGFLIESAMFGGRDVLDFPLEVKPGEDVGGWRADVLDARRPSSPAR